MDFCHKTKFVPFLGALNIGVFSLFDLYPVEQPTTKHVDKIKNKPDADRIIINNKGKKPFLRRLKT
jgi:hypothetical protein